MQGSHTDLSQTSNKSTECTCVAIMFLVAFVLLITQYQTNQQLSLGLRERKIQDLMKETPECIPGN